MAAMIKKLPPSWVDFKNYLKHKRKEMSVEDLIVRLRIEEDNKLALNNSYVPYSAKENVVKVDAEATSYVCSNKSLFISVKEVINGEQLFIGNSATADIKVEGNVVLKLTSGNELKLENVLFS
ncbi:hypothetical protein Tco_0292238 [Tanacetum coccineum]